jgi:4-hydroxyphenylacetate 3-monooxygenase/4-hydroxybutyryl-CoA dehydratase/vinylacetyl-CoA-Delta-isomerase
MPLGGIVYAAGKEGAYRAEKASSGTFIPDEIITNAARKMAGESIYDEYKILIDLAGGLAATLPLEKDFFSEETAELANKYLKRNPKVSPENIHRCFRGIQDLAVCDYGACFQVAGLHGGGSPQMESIAMMSRYDLESLKGISKYLFGIERNCRVYQVYSDKKMLEKSVTKRKN